MAFTYDPTTDTYTDDDGDPVAFARVLAALTAVIEHTRARLLVLGQQRAEAPDDPSWVRAVEDELEQAHLAAAALAAGGTAQVTSAVQALLEQRLAVQFGYLAGFAAVLGNGAFGGAEMARLAMYADAAWGTFEAVRRDAAADRGITVERNVLGSARHCAECPELTGQGWVPLGTLPLPGDRECISRCHCWIDYSEDAVDAEEAV